LPCGTVPQEWTHAIYAKLRQYRVDFAVIQAGLKLARADGYVFDDPTSPPITTIPTVIKPIHTGQRPMDVMGVPSENPRQALKHAAEMLEFRYENAMNTHNYATLLLNSF
jgi:hypothetical protein